MTIVSIPPTIKAATAQLEGLESLLTAKQWERAAIVYAFTYEGVNRFSSGPVLGRYTIRQFADLKIKGLSSRETIKHYRDNWKLAVESEDAPEGIEPGDRVYLPEIDWPIEKGNAGSRVSVDPETAVQQVIDKHGANAAAAALATKAPQAVASQVAKPAVAQAAMADPKARGSLIKGAAQARAAAATRSKMPTPKQVDTTPEKDEITALELQGLITEFHIAAGKAEDEGRKAFDIYKRMEQYLTAEQMADLTSVADGPLSTWQMVQESILSEGVTDDALQDLINQAQGES